MRTAQTTLTGADVQGYAEGLLARHLRLRDHGPTATARAVYRVLLFAATTAATIASACKRLLGAPCKQSVYNALGTTLPGRAELQRRLNHALAGAIPRALRSGRRAARVAIDLVLLPYYGRPDRNDDLVYKGQERAGTHLHHAYATAYLVRKGRRFTLAMMAVRHDTPWDETVGSLLRLARTIVPSVGLVLVDRGFYSVAVIRYLQRARYPFLMPVIGRGRKTTDPRGPSATRVFFAWKRGGWGRYQLTERRGQARASFDVAVVVRRKVRKRPGGKRRSARVWVYACWGVRGCPAAWVNEAYRRRRLSWLRLTYRGRFGIETSYRQMNQGRAWTTSPCPKRRLLLVGLALLLRNVWVLLHWQVLAQSRRGGRRLCLELLTLAAMLDWIADVLKALLGYDDQIETQHAFIL
jgi:putative transposase